MSLSHIMLVSHIHAKKQEIGYQRGWYVVSERVFYLYIYTMVLIIEFIS